MTITRSLAVHYGAISLFSSLLHNIFLLYHVEMFVSIYKIDKTSFWIGETVFLVWNSCNDPLFGWLSDRSVLTGGSSSAGMGGVILQRLWALQWAGPLFALSFLLFWISWTVPAVQFVLCLCLYDGFLTMIDLHHSSLLADLAVSADTRTTLNFHAAVFSALGSLSVFVSYAFWSRESIGSFQLFCALTALISMCGFVMSARRMRQIFPKVQQTEGVHNVNSDKPLSWACDPGIRPEREALKKFVKDLAGHQNFLWFTVMNLIQVFHCHFNSNFFPLFLDNLLSDSIPQIICTFILGLSFVAPHINNLYFLSLCRRYGVYSVIRGLFLLKLLLSVVMATIGAGHMWLLCVFIASNRVFTEGTCKLLTLVISDLVDEDFVLHHRKQAVSALVFGTTALLSKPGQTLAPLLGTWLLARQTGHDVFASGDSMKADLSGMSLAAQAEYRAGVFSLLVYVPIVCAIVQLLAWSRFTLHGKRLHWVKSVRQGAVYTTV